MLRFPRVTVTTAVTRVSLQFTWLMSIIRTGGAAEVVCLPWDSRSPEWEPGDPLSSPGGRGHQGLKVVLVGAVSGHWANLSEAGHQQTASGAVRRGLLCAEAAIQFTKPISQELIVSSPYVLYQKQCTFSF